MSLAISYSARYSSCPRDQGIYFLCRQLHFLHFAADNFQHQVLEACDIVPLISEKSIVMTGVNAVRNHQFGHPGRVSYLEQPVKAQAALG